MSKLGNSLKMLFMLRTGTLIKGKEIANKLETTVKEVRRYKEVLDEFFEIESVPGPNGGYRLKDTYFPFKEVLTEDEVLLIKNAVDSLDSTMFENNLVLKKAVDKINYSILNNKEEVISEQLIPYSRIKSLDENYKKILDDIYKAMFNRVEIIISYKDNNGKCSRRRVQPYKYLRYKGEKYLVAYCLMRNEIRFFKLARIQEYTITTVKFNRTIDINKVLVEYKSNSIGIYSGKEYRIILEIDPPIANTIKERLWVDNQEVEELGEGKIKFKAIMKGGPEIITWILSMGECVKIIEPTYLREEIYKKLQKMIKNI